MHTKKSHFGMYFVVLALLTGAIFLVVGERIESSVDSWEALVITAYAVIGSKIAAIGSLIMASVIDERLYWRNPHRLPDY